MRGKYTEEQFCERLNSQMNFENEKLQFKVGDFTEDPKNAIKSALMKSSANHIFGKLVSTNDFNDVKLLYDEDAVLSLHEDGLLKDVFIVNDLTTGCVIRKNEYESDKKVNMYGNMTLGLYTSK